MNTFLLEYILVLALVLLLCIFWYRRQIRKRKQESEEFHAVIREHELMVARRIAESITDPHMREETLAYIKEAEKKQERK